ncbi:phosphatase 2C-like domain-containing protein [Mycena sanguinolenta]|nr:phosphatase 2C-like domain-containing protein [Mycena sanguinolenta]
MAGIDFVRLPGRDRTRVLETEDRYFGAQWNLRNGPWKLAVVLDGHGHTTAAVDFVLETLPGMVQAGLLSALEESNSESLPDFGVSKILSELLITLDDRIKNDFISLLPPDNNLSGFDASVALRDADGRPCVEVERALSGTTATVALIDPSNRIHVASVGDCDTVLCVKTENGWDCLDMGFHHQSSNPVEMARIEAEHPGETDCITNKQYVARLLGGMPLSRGIGDMHFKLPADLVRILEAGCGRTIWKSFIDNNKTPPYMSNIPEIAHTHMPGQKFLIIASDGLDDLMERSLKRKISTQDHGKIYAAAAARAPVGKNLAVEVLWEAFGGDSEGNIYGDAIAGKLQGRVDDITIAVVSL